jgi:hypothetical protein
LRNNLPVGSVVTHAPMDVDMLPGTAYFVLLQRISYTLDFLMPQYYNGVTRPAADGFQNSNAGQMAAYVHYQTLVDIFFGGDATRIVFGFCISDCSSTGSNASPNQAAAVMVSVGDSYACHGGAFFWVAQHDGGGLWSSSVNSAMDANRGCSGGTDPVGKASVEPSGSPSSSPSTSVQPSGIPSSSPSTSVQPSGSPSSSPSTSVPPSGSPSNEPSASAHPSDIITERPTVGSAVSFCSVLPFDIELNITQVPEEYKGAFSTAVTRWESVIVGDIPDVFVNFVVSSWCGPIALKNIDDLLICATVRFIDGPFGILGSAGPEFSRVVGSLPVIGGMEFDEDDMAFMQTQGIYENVIVSHICESQRTH